MIHYHQIAALLEAHRSDFEEERFFLKLSQNFAEQHPEQCCERNFTLGHFTASAWLLNPARDAILLIHHRGLDKWFQPGGHLERSDESLLEASRRELLEECGVSGADALSEQLFDLDIHLIPAKGDIPEHCHYDLRFAFIADENTVLAPDFSEIKDLKWFNLKALLETPLQQSLRRMALKTLQIL